MKKTTVWNNLTFVVEDDAITIFDHNRRRDPLPEDRYTIPPERKAALLKAVFDVFVKKAIRHDEVYWLMSYIIENPDLILFPPARYNVTHPTEGKGEPQTKKKGDEKK